MPATAANPSMGVKPLQNDSEEEAKRFTTDYLTALTERYGGDIEKGLTAYIAGAGNVDTWVNSYEKNPPTVKTDPAATLAAARADSVRETQTTQSASFGNAARLSQDTDVSLDNLFQKNLNNDASVDDVANGLAKTFTGADAGYFIRELEKFREASAVPDGNGGIRYTANYALIGDIIRQRGIESRGFFDNATSFNSKNIEGGDGNKYISTKKVQAALDTVKTFNVGDQRQSRLNKETSASNLVKAQTAFDAADAAYQSVVKQANGRNDVQWAGRIKQYAQQRDLAKLALDAAQGTSADAENQPVRSGQSNASAAIAQAADFTSSIGQQRAEYKRVTGRDAPF